ncbi:MAG: hypothetical protein V1899_09030 [Planctomycetota bacterium]
MTEQIYDMRSEISLRHWPVAVAVTLFLHGVPFFLLTLPLPVFPEINTSIEIALNTDAIMVGEFAPLRSASIEQTSDNVALNDSTKSPTIAAIKESPAVLAAKAIPPVATVKQVEDKSKLTQPFFVPLLKPRAAFDESKTTQESPDKGYLSDRTSTAADRGSKNLKRGDPFIDKGESKIIAALQKRGENKLPAPSTDLASGSVKKEGSPDVGKKNISVHRGDICAVKPQPKGVVDGGTGGRGDGEKQLLPKSRQKSLHHAKILTVSSAEDAKENSIKEITEKIIGTVESSRRVRLSETAQHSSVANTIADSELGDIQFADKPTLNATAVDELEAFKAALENATRKSESGNETDAKIGVRDRPGALGHEGNGTPLPGHTTAVSNVTSINLNSSAAEFDEARFAKIADPVIAYFKPLLRRTDGKWKAEIVARNRARILSGVVALKIMMRKDGALLDVLEVSRFPSELPDDYVAIARLAVQRAAEGKAEPFPLTLEKFETLEISIGFIY